MKKNEKNDQQTIEKKKKEMLILEVWLRREATVLLRLNRREIYEKSAERIRSGGTKLDSFSHNQDKKNSQRWLTMARLSCCSFVWSINKGRNLVAGKKKASTGPRLEKDDDLWSKTSSEKEQFKANDAAFWI